MALPQTVAQVEQLVKQLYQPGSPKVVQQINDELQRLQLSQEGWKLADELMASADPNVRFFAALTFTVKLNNDGPTLDAETAQTVLTRLLYWLARLIDHGEGVLVCKKLCSTITTYFVRSPIAWTYPLQQVAQSFAAVSDMPGVDANGHAVVIRGLLPQLTTLQLRALLWIAGDLAGEVGKMDTNLQAHARSYEEMERTVVDVNALLRWSLSQANTENAQSVRADALQTFLMWVNYAQPIWPRNPEALQYLRDIIEPAAQNVMDPNVQTEALDIFRDILESYTSFFQPAHVEALSALIADFIQPAITHALATRDPRVVPMVQLVVAFGCAYVQQVAEEPENDRSSKTILHIHHQILSTPGYPGDDDELSIQSIEFWNTYIEYINDTVYSRSEGDTQPAWRDAAFYNTQQLVELMWRKMWIPPNEVKKEWTENESEAFKEFRLDASDLMLSISAFLGSQMLQQLVSYMLQALNSKEWRAVEAALFCLNALSDNVLEDLSRSDTIGDVFRSSLYRDIADFSQAIPLQARRTAIDLLGSYGEYIEQHNEFLPDTLRFLFASLEVGTLANAAAKSIASLCSACRISLTSELDGFLMQYQRFLESPTADSYTKEKVVGAIAAIIQAITPESGKGRPLISLIEHIEKDILLAKDFSAKGDVESAETTGVTALECLASIGKGLQAPEDVPIDIYDDEETRTKTSTYWDSDEGRAIQQRIVGCFSVLQIIGNSSGGIEAACQVLRSGFTETLPGAFVLPSSVMVSFLQQCSVETPQLETVLSTAGTLIYQHSGRNDKRIDTDVAAIYGCTIGFIQILGQPSRDPVVAMGCIVVATRMMPTYIHILLSSNVTALLEFAIAAIQGPDNFPKRSACEFWTKLIKPQSAATCPEVQQRLREVMQNYGPKLGRALMYQIGGQAQRSELDLLCEPLKALLMADMHIQNWLQQSLTDADFPAAHVAMTERSKFLRQLLSVRSDGRRIKDIIRAFWAACRGTVVSYGS